VACITLAIAMGLAAALVFLWIGQGHPAGPHMTMKSAFDFSFGFGQLHHYQMSSTPLAPRIPPARFTGKEAMISGTSWEGGSTGKEVLM